jgi:hypothetical protein
MKIMSNLLLINNMTPKNHGWQTKIAVILEKSIPTGRVMKRSDWPNGSNSRPTVTFSYKLPVYDHVTLLSHQSYPYNLASAAAVRPLPPQLIRV